MARTSAFKLAMLVGALALAGIAVANQWRLSRIESELSERVGQLEGPLEIGHDAPPAALLAQAEPTQPGPDPEVRAQNPTVSALAGVRPVGSKQPESNRTYEIDISTSPSKGPADAPITIVEFSDFQCGFCRRARPTLARIAEVYGDQVRWIWKHLPLSIHEDAPMAHLASVAAARQGKFWEFEEKLYGGDPPKLKPEDLRQYAFEIGLKMQQFEEDLADPATRAVVEADMAEALAIDLTATPGFFVNGRYIRGAKPFEVFAEVINDELASRDLQVPEAARVEPES